MFPTVIAPAVSQSYPKQRLKLGIFSADKGDYFYADMAVNVNEQRFKHFFCRNLDFWFRAMHNEMEFGQ